ncbi:zinc-binding dehydrogenase [Spongiactinospora sp. TRM90649]|uniref:zinc-binding dehydrogenase n=1 Tax=Spongiactinospora sp. TRM90649 TaxID=3031114 RepID=UPI0023F81057|nr:zinc-binding dehydrogenase [Spongiactinospora sp. TRM90649]MDF5757092.1 zinc-binding dehydrogenase [Spongiactinospora sp. TRM90649]
MRAILLHAFGPPENLRYEEAPDPEPGPGQVRIAVRAAGVHLVDTTIRAGQFGGPFAEPELPTIPGREVAGVVDALGEGVPDSWLGRRVVAHLGMVPGGYAELAVRDVAAVHELPDGLGFDAAVAMIGTGRTTMAILEDARLGAGDVAVVTAAAGGIGALLVQAGRRAGATVVGLAGGPAKVARVRDLGADVAVDYTVPGWPDEVRRALDGRPATVALDGVGGQAGQAAMDLLGPGGRLLLFGWSDAAGGPLQITTADLYSRGLTAGVPIGPRFLGRPGAIRELEERAMAAAATGELTPLVQPFALKDAAEAHAALEGRATMGKVVLVP